MAATRPYVNVSAVVHPLTTLDSVDVNADGMFDDGTDDFRYVDLEVYIQGNVQFWAVDMTCRFNSTYLTSYVQNASATDTGDDTPMITWGPAWYEGPEVNNFTDVPITVADVPVIASTGSISLLASRLGDTTPLGMNGMDYTMLLATVRLRVQDSLRDANVAITCNPSKFLNRDGESVINGRSVRSSSLQIYNGYKVSGSVALQGSRVATNITIDCTTVPSGMTPFQVVTNSAGKFSFPSAARSFGKYRCLIHSNISNLDTTTQDKEPYLAGAISFNLQTPHYQLLPVVLKAGNTHTTNDAIGAQQIDFATDIVTITNHWNEIVATAYTSGDTNGDRRVNIADLALAAGNLDEAETVEFSHIIYGLATTYGNYFPDSRVWWGDPDSGAVELLVNNRSTPDFWPAVSPDGRYVALSRYNSRTGFYELYKVDIVRYPDGRATRLTPASGYTHQVFAPSWSPDGQRIAFICSEAAMTTSGNKQVLQDLDAQDWAYNKGDLCVIDADGNNLYKIASDAGIYPPAWYDDNIVVYAGTSANAICPNDLCYYDFQTVKTSLIETFFAGEGSATGNEVADMPSVGYDGTKAYLYYRFRNGSSVYLRYAVLNSNLSAGSPFSHPTTTANVDYYNVSPTLDIIFYEFGSDLFQNLLYNGGGSWSLGDTHYVDGYVGNPAWDGNASTATTLFGLRATVQWLP